MKNLFYLLLIILLGGLLLYLGKGILSFQEQEIADLEDKIALLKSQHTPIKFKVTEKTAEKISFSMAFFDAEGQKISSENFSLNGKELMFDFYLIKVRDRYVAFPYKVFTDEIAPDNGTLLFSYYDKDNFPQIFFSKNMDLELKKLLTILFEKSKSGEIEKEETYFGNVVHDIAGIKEFKQGYVYKIVSFSAGGMEVTEDM